MSSNNAGRNSELESISETAAPHPEEMKATVKLAIGQFCHDQGNGPSYTSGPGGGCIAHHLDPRSGDLVHQNPPA
jgi:hypothetical protein